MRTAALLPWAAAVLLAACSVGPDYVRPDAHPPSVYKELADWKVAEPADTTNRGPWWELFGDAQLNALEARVDAANQNVRLAEAQFREARALLDATRAGFFPTLTGNISATGTAKHGSGPTKLYNATLDASWEPDVWGRVRRAVEADSAGAEASAADLASIRLSAHAELAQDYFLLRAADAGQKLLNDTATGYERTLQLTKNQYAAGIASQGDVAQAQTQLMSTRAQAVDIGIQRAQLEHAIALLVGEPPSSFTIPPGELSRTVPVAPAGLPSQLLERRPDIAAAERRMASANAGIGVAKSAYYPSFSVGGSGGFSAAALAPWFTAPSLIWSLGPSVAQSIFDGGLRRAQTTQARAAYDASVATYRQTVLTGLQEVEDNLVALRLLEQEATVQDEAVEAAEKSLRIVTNQYKAGIVSYLNVVVAQAQALSNERTAVTIAGNRLTASVLLIKALGGGWDTQQLASEGTLP